MTNGSSTVIASGAGCVLILPKREPLKYALVMTFRTINNKAEYEVLITGLLVANGVEITNIHIKCDYQLVVQQVLGQCEANEDRMSRYAHKAKDLSKFPKLVVEQVPHEENAIADSLSKVATESLEAKGIHVELLKMDAS
ncbi:hypothetical protein CRG98_033297 [Punica granatum]|uniref:RNase H type-1 domain-containing protein n=1 Tax=Punica granatum TaxID=22663 RepID=A0A2I0IQN5_PUNGR|nr:hypothetical protein CRG98_033297 [Punica granatum]